MKKNKSQHQELISLIAACAKHRVDEISLNDGGITSVKFFAPENARANSSTGETALTEDLNELAANAAIAEANNRSLSDEDRLELLKIEDPEAYEQALIEREVIDSGESESESGEDEN